MCARDSQATQMLGRTKTTSDLQKPHLPKTPFSRGSRHLYTIPDAPEQFLHSFQPSIQPLRPSYDVFRHTLTFSAFSVHTWALSACFDHTPTHQGPLCSAQDTRHASAVHKRPPPLVPVICSVSHATCERCGPRMHGHPGCATRPGWPHLLTAQSPAGGYCCRFRDSICIRRSF